MQGFLSAKVLRKIKSIAYIVYFKHAFFSKRLQKKKKKRHFKGIIFNNKFRFHWYEYIMKSLSLMSLAFKSDIFKPQKSFKNV